jgi:hypothetical protein
MAVPERRLIEADFTPEKVGGRSICRPYSVFGPTVPLRLLGLVEQSAME